jgi:hypothetical protein
MKLGLGLGLGSGNRLPRYVTDYFNGFELSGSTYTGGPVVTEDNTGALVTSPAGVLPIEGMRLATTVAEGAELGPARWEGETPDVIGAGWVNNGDGSYSHTGASSYMRVNSVLSAGGRFLFEATAAGPGVLTLYYGAGNIVYGPLSGDASFEEVADGNDLHLYIYADNTITISEVLLREVIPTWLPTDLSGDPIHTSTPLRTRKGTVSVYDEGYKGPLIQPARTNKVTCQKSDPTVTTNISVTGGTLSVASDPGTLIVDAKLTKQCLTGKLFKWVNASGSTQTATLVGQAGNTNKQSLRVYAESTGAAGTVSLQGVGSVAIPNQAGLAEYTSENLTPAASTDQMQLTLADGGTMYFILHQLEEGTFVTSPICKDSTGTDPLTALTRPAANLTRPTAGTALESGNNFAIYGRVIPESGGQAGFAVFGIETDTNNRVDLRFVAGNLYNIKKITGVEYLARVAYTHAANTPFEYLAYQHSVHGMGIAVRSWNGSAWSAWSAWATNADTQNAPIATTYQIGARNNANHFAGNYPFTKIISIPASANPQAWLMEKMSQGRI